jgi:hypothetical protein
MDELTRRGFMSVTGGGLALLASPGLAQQQGFDPNEIGRRALQQPFVGITSDGTVRDGLYDIENTGVPTTQVALAATALLQGLTVAQRKRAQYSIDDPEWRHWSNMHIFQPQGVAIRELDGAQQQLAHELLARSLSKQGYDKARNIMRLNHTLAELTNDFEGYGENRYWLTFMGEPFENQPWGWQIDGHHLIINYFVLGDQVVMSPVFMGSEPTVALSGKYAGTTILQPEETNALGFIQQLPENHRRAAIIGPKGRSENLAEMFKDNVVIPFQGLRADQLSARDRDALLGIVELYIANMDDGHAAIRMREVRQHIDETYFAWKGETASDAVFYYRIHSPVVLIEFGHQGPIALAGERTVATRNHIHTVVRTPNGNDYGKVLLRKHVDAAPGD